MRTAPHGTWTSPITAADAAKGQTLVEWVALVGAETWWVEKRPQEAGRAALVRRTPNGKVLDALGSGWSVRNRVIEYGGRPWLPLGDEAAAGFVFTHWDDQRVYRAQPGSTPAPISPQPARTAAARYCDFVRAGDEVWCLREESVGDEPTDVRRDLVALPLDGSARDDPAAVRLLAHSHHFMTGPKISSDGRHAVWLGWDHPDMPWDRTDVMCAPVGPAGTLGQALQVAGGEGVAVSQVEWAPDRPDLLYLLSDAAGWWNLHEVTLDGSARALCPRAEEFGDALWRIGAQWFLPLGGGRLAVVHGLGQQRLAILEPDGTVRDFDSSYTEWASLAAAGRRVVATAAGPWHAGGVVQADLHDREVRILRAGRSAPADFLPRGYHEVFKGADGTDVHAYVYPPRNPDFAAPEGELPPYVVHAHGGPTSRTPLVPNEEIAYFTSRGIGVVDVQYGGSTGFGRQYRERLREGWGDVDVRDCAIAARGLIEQGLADPERIGIRGCSAGGWTAAVSLTAEPELYRAAALYYPLLDPEEWRARGTHDFESQYLHSLIGPWPQTRHRYAQRSPLRTASEIRAPFVLMQGLEDEICPPEHADRLLARLRGGTVPHAYLAFAGEQHGFRRADSLIACLHAELSVYAQVFGFDAAGIPKTELSSTPDSAPDTGPDSKALEARAS
ncbi:alpha/beta hydrolase family protein [Streptomyces sp. NPDC002814]